MSRANAADVDQLGVSLLKLAGALGARCRSRPRRLRARQVRRSGSSVNRSGPASTSRLGVDEHRARADPPRRWPRAQRRQHRRERVASGVDCLLSPRPCRPRPEADGARSRRAAPPHHGRGPIPSSATIAALGPAQADVDAESDAPSERSATEHLSRDDSSQLNRAARAFWPAMRPVSGHRLVSATCANAA